MCIRDSTLTISTEFCHGKAGRGMDKQYPILQLLQNFAMAKQNMARISSTHFDHFYRILPWQSRTWQGQAVPTLTISTEFCHVCRQVSADKLCGMDSMVSPLWLCWVMGVCMSNCNLPPALLAKWLGSLTWRCVTRGGTDTEIRVSTKGEKKSLAASAGTHIWPSTHKSGALPMSYASAHLRTDWMQFPILCLYH